jgi:hypothetical protein
MIAYRGVYHLVPLGIALVVLGGHEAQNRLTERGRQQQEELQHDQR